MAVSLGDGFRGNNVELINLRFRAYEDGIEMVFSFANGHESSPEFVALLSIERAEFAETEISGALECARKHLDENIARAVWEAMGITRKEKNDSGAA